ncbi:hypothetical protein KGY77_07115 [Candidatus Bipolaricaulota bacterium]|nr:hypothetical protein [Candidatus Bipolaricaulota bacterium]
MVDSPNDLRRFKGRNQSFKKKVSIRKSGQLAINVGTVRAYQLDEYPGVLLYFGRESHTLGIEPTHDTEADGFIKSYVHNDTIQLNVRSFLDLNDIPYDKTRQAPVTGYDSERKMVLADLEPVFEAAE